MTDPTLTDLIQHYSNENLVRFFQKRSRDFSAINAAYPSFDKDSFTTVTKIGQIDFNLIDSLSVWSIKVNHDLSQRSGKLNQYKIAIRILNELQDLNGVFVFYDPSGNFRFSLIYKTPIYTKSVGSNYKRFTYYVSPELTNKTFIQRFVNLELSSLKSVNDAFLVEPVTTQFFTEFRTIFDKTKKEFQDANKNTVLKRLQSKYEKEELEEQINKFTFTFLGRIIFLYFLLRKGWIEGRSDFVRRFVEEKNRHNLYQSLLEPLFFEVFAKEEAKRLPEIQQAYKNTPYLNGGLFEHSELELEMKKEGILILFRDPFIRDIISNFFEAYNFTVDENSPDDQEVSIDPEMLGKVFENTLAEEERNKKGTFYTPREIVHFMVRQSIERHLLNETSVDPQKIHALVYSNHSDFPDITIREANALDKKLELVKVLDPAVGSGAFPVEFMNTLIELRKKLGVHVGRNINEVALKKSIIKNNLYGVDIDPGAIEIAKLRLWLSLIVDYDRSLVEPLPSLDFQFRVGNSLQETIDGIDVFQSQPVTSQLGWIEESEAVNSHSAQMISLKDDFYSTTNEEARHNLKKQFDALEQELIQSRLDDLRDQYLLQSMQHNQRDQENARKTLKRIQNLEQKIEDGTYKLFKPDFHFSEVFQRADEQGRPVGGFDIVIGNPPYGVKVENEIRNWHKLGSKDSYGVFIATSLTRFLKPGGVLEFITSDTWLTIDGHQPLRQQILETNVHLVARLHKDCFDATVNACIVNITNSKVEENLLLVADLTNISTRLDIGELKDKLINTKNYLGVSNSILGVYSYSQKEICANSNLPIFAASPLFFNRLFDKDESRRFHNATLRLGQIADIKYGIRTGKNSEFFYIEPRLSGSYRDITPYKASILNEIDLSTLSTEEKLNGIDPKKHGGKYIVPLNKGGESDTKDNWLPKYYVESGYYFDWSRASVAYLKEIRGMRNPDIHFAPGITFSWTGEYAPTFRISTLGVYDQSSSAIINIQYFTVEELLGLLNSKLIKYQLKNYIDHTVNSNITAISSLVIPIGDLSQVSPIVTNIISNQKIDPMYDFSSEEKEIDSIVYDLYNLNEEYIREVESWYARRYPRLVQE